MNPDRASIVVPDSIEPVIGWKNLFYKEGGLLYSPTYKMLWRPKGRAYATCQRADGRRSATWPPSGRSLPHSVGVPDKHCTCGIYMVKDMASTFGYLAGGASGYLNVISKVAGWGNVVPATAGYRVQYAYPQELLVLPGGKTRAADLKKIVAGLQKTYGVPARLFTQDDLDGIAAPEPPFSLTGTAPKTGGAVVPNTYWYSGSTGSVSLVTQQGFTTRGTTLYLDPSLQRGLLPRSKQRVWHLAAFAAINAVSAVLNASFWYFGSRSTLSLIAATVSAATAVTLGVLVKRIRKANNG